MPTRSANSAISRLVSPGGDQQPLARPLFARLNLHAVELALGSELFQPDAAPLFVGELQQDARQVPGLAEVADQQRRSRALPPGAQHAEGIGADQGGALADLGERLPRGADGLHRHLQVGVADPGAKGGGAVVLEALLHEDVPAPGAAARQQQALRSVALQRHQRPQPDRASAAG